MYIHYHSGSTVVHVGFCSPIDDAFDIIAIGLYWQSTFPHFIECLLQVYGGCQGNFLGLECIFNDLRRGCYVVFCAPVSVEASLLWSDDGSGLQAPLYALIDDSLHGLENTACKTDIWASSMFSELGSSSFPLSNEVHVLRSSFV